MDWRLTTGAPSRHLSTWHLTSFKQVELTWLTFFFVQNIEFLLKMWAIQYA